MHWNEKLQMGAKFEIWRQKQKIFCQRNKWEMHSTELLVLPGTLVSPKKEEKIMFKRLSLFLAGWLRKLFFSRIIFPFLFAHSLGFCCYYSGHFRHDMSGWFISKCIIFHSSSFFIQFVMHFFTPRPLRSKEGPTKMRVKSKHSFLRLLQFDWASKICAGNWFSLSLLTCY